MGTGFGLWLGPRGGYSKAKQFAKRVQKGNNGYFNKNANDICIASSKYVNKLTDFLIDTVSEFDITYLKLDGFSIMNDGISLSGSSPFAVALLTAAMIISFNLSCVSFTNFDIAVSPAFSFGA